MSRGSGVPRFLDGDTLYYDSDTGEESDDSSDCEATPDNPDLDFVSDNPKQKHTNSTLSHPDDHNTSNLTEELIFNSGKIYDWITDFGKQSSQAIDARRGNEGSVKYMENL